LETDFLANKSNVSSLNKVTGLQKIGDSCVKPTKKIMTRTQWFVFLSVYFQIQISQLAVRPNQTVEIPAC